MSEPAQTSSTAKRSFGKGALFAAALLGGAIATGTTLLVTRSSTPAPATSNATTAAEKWQCPMHPSVVQDHPGTCPICGMTLVPMGQGGGEAKPEHKVVFYRSPMDPKQTSPTPRKDGMGMDYVPVYSDELPTAPSVEGLSTVSIDPARQQLIGLTTVPVERGTVGGEWRTVGTVAVDETRVRHVNIKVSGFVDKVFVDYVGRPVKKGEPLFTVYSPELYSAQEEYLLALRTRKTLAEGGMGKNGDELVAAARRKLQLWDIPDSELQKLEASGQAQRTLTLYSPIAGVVTKKDVVDGMKLDPGAMPYEIVDLSQVWVLADVYESELGLVKRGMPATLVLKAFPNRLFNGKVAFIDPLLDPKTRTVKVRIEFPNPTGDLRPEMFGEVTLKIASREALRIPADAVINSGTQNVVFIALSDGKFQPRAVKLGESDGTHVEVVDGLTEGDHVVTRANFLIDSESRLKASLGSMSAAATSDGGGSAKPAADAHAGHGGI